MDGKPRDSGAGKYNVLRAGLYVCFIVLIWHVQCHEKATGMESKFPLTAFPRPCLKRSLMLTLSPPKLFTSQKDKAAIVPDPPIYAIPKEDATIFYFVFASEWGLFSYFNAAFLWHKAGVSVFRNGRNGIFIGFMPGENVQESSPLQRPKEIEGHFQ